MRRGKAFTLVELLIVVGIIALLVTIIMPSLGRAKELARKAVCATKLQAHGKGVLMYVTESESYPLYAQWPNPGMTNPQGMPFLFVDWSWGDGCELLGWPKFYGVLQAEEIQGTRMTTWGLWYYGGDVDEVWDGAWCPSQDAPRMLQAANDAGQWGFNGNHLWWTWDHKWAIGYTWSDLLRAATPWGRYPNWLHPGYLWDYPYRGYDRDLYQWIQPNVYLADGEHYCTQAVRPDEIAQPASCAEAWDSMDLETAPNIAWTSAMQSGGEWTPGWWSGPPQVRARGMLNGNRHQGCPNILYADGHVASDALDEVNPASYGLAMPDFKDAKLYTYERYDPDLFGNMDRFVPTLEFGQ